MWVNESVFESDSGEIYDFSKQDKPEFKDGLKLFLRNNKEDFDVKGSIEGTKQFFKQIDKKTCLD